MKLTGLFKQEPPFTDTRRKLRSAIAAGKTTEDADADTALRLILDSLDLVEFAMAIEERDLLRELARVGPIVVVIQDRDVFAAGMR